jgi:hypothetical protein
VPASGAIPGGGGASRRAAAAPTSEGFLN